jgi:hypothetical protein
MRRAESGNGRRRSILHRAEIGSSGGKPTFAAATVNGQLAPSPGGGDGKIDLIEKFCEV